MNARTRISQQQFDEIYRLDVIEALERDTQLDFQDIRHEKYLQKGVCPKCSERTLYIARSQPYQLKCNRMNECQFEEKTRERYSYLFENLSERFPSTPENPNATADAYLQRNRGFDISKLAGSYTQARRKLADGSYGDTVRFPLCNGYWERIIDTRAVARNDGDKAGIKYQMTYKGDGWTPPGQTIEKNDRVYIVEGIFHAIALHLAGFKVIAAISCNNFPWLIIEANKGKLITWCIALDNDKAGRQVIPKYLKMLRELREIGWVALGDPERDWDDVYRDGQLDAAYMDEACYQGRLFTATSAMHKAYLQYIKRKRGFYLVEFGNRLYTAAVAISTLDEALNDEKIDGNRDTFSQHTTINQVANCVPRFEYVEKDAITGEQRYFFRFDFPNGRPPSREPLTPSAISEPRGFTKALLERTPGGMFDGGEKVLAMLKSEWLNNPSTVRTLPFIGYDETTGVYCFPTFGFHKGNEILTNDHGFLDVDGQGLKTSTRSYPMVRGTDFDPFWFPDFRVVFDLSGLVALAWWTGTLFAQQIRAKHGIWSFLELTGEAGAGKSTLLRFLWKLCGRANEEGVKPSGSGASAIGLIRALAAVSNLPVVLLESDKEVIDSQGRVTVIQFNWDDIKPLSDHNAKLRVTGVKSNNADTDSLIFRGGVCISQNTNVDGSEAIITRIVYEHMTTEHHRFELEALAERLKEIPVKQAAGYLRAVLNRESEWLARFEAAYPRYKQRFQAVKGVKHARIIQLHAQVMAAAEATSMLFPTWGERDLDAMAQHLELRALDRQQRISAENRIAAQFWQIFHFLNEDVVTITDGEGTREEIRETLNHSADKGLIAVNLEHFQQACRQAGQEVIPAALLRRHLPQSSTFKFLEHRKVRSRIEKRPLNCLVFLKQGQTR